MIPGLTELILFLIVPTPLLICLSIIIQRRFSIQKLVCQLHLPWCCESLVAVLITIGFFTYICSLGLLGIDTIQLFISSNVNTVGSMQLLLLAWMIIVAINVLLIHQLTRNCKAENTRQSLWSFLLFALFLWTLTAGYGMAMSSIIPNLEKMIMGLMAWNSWVVVLAIYLLYLCICWCD